MTFICSIDCGISCGLSRRFCRLRQQSRETGRKTADTVRYLCFQYGEGSALLKNPNLIEEIVRKVSSAISKPLTVKVRIGFENEPVDIVEIAKRIEDAAYEKYAEGDGKTEYECIEWAANHSVEIL